MSDSLLPGLRIPEYINAKFDYSGIDSPDHCLDQSWFRAWPHPITYHYNSRGFRDREWPASVESVVWCVGDSFTAGVGSAFEHTWPQILAKFLAKPVINISLDGASNDWICRRVCEIYDAVHPQNIVIMWSYGHRRESPNTALSDCSRRLQHVKSTTLEDFKNLQSCFMRVHNHCVKSNVVDFQIPGGFCNEPDAMPLEIGKNIIQIKQLDYARDHHHFDIVTATWVAEQTQPRLVL